MRQLLVVLHFHDLRVDHDEAQLIRRKAADQACDDAVDAHALATARGTRDEQMRHGREIADDRLAIHVLAQRDGELGLAVDEHIVLQQLAQRHDGLLRVGQFDAHGVFARNRREDVDALGACGTGDVRIQIRDAAHAQTIDGTHFIAGDRRATGDVPRLHADAKARQRFDDGGLDAKQLALVRRRTMRLLRPFQQLHGGQLVVLEQLGQISQRAMRRLLHLLRTLLLPDLGQLRFVRAVLMRSGD